MIKWILKWLRGNQYQGGLCLELAARRSNRPARPRIKPEKISLGFERRLQFGSRQYDAVDPGGKGFMDWPDSRDFQPQPQ